MDTMSEDLAASYERCRELHRRHGRTYYLATRLLPAWKRRHVHALYGFTRYADEIVDRTEDLPPAERAARLNEWSERFLAGLRGEPIDDPLLPAVLHTIAVFDLDLADFDAFLRSMAMDLTVTAYPTYDDLLHYMEGSAAVIGTMMLPILGSSDPAAAREPARQLGLAFQLTNFIRDVAATPRIKDLIRYEVSVAKDHYRQAAHGIPMLHPASQACMRTAFRLYGGILDEVAAADYDVFTRRATVPNQRRVSVAVRSILTRPGTPIEVPA
jgi:phytoene synthase